MGEELNINSIIEKAEKPRRGLNTMGLFAVMASLLMYGAILSDSKWWVVVFIGACILAIIAFAEAVVHYLRFYSVIISLLFCGLAIYHLVSGK